MNALRPIVGQAFRQMREARGLSVADVYDLTHREQWPGAPVTKRKLVNFENGGSWPKLDYILSLLILYSPDQATLNIASLQTFVEEAAREKPGLRRLFAYPPDHPRIDLLMARMTRFERRVQTLEKVVVNRSIGGSSL